MTTVPETLYPSSVIENEGRYPTFVRCADGFWYRFYLVMLDDDETGGGLRLVLPLEQSYGFEDFALDLYDTDLLGHINVVRITPATHEEIRWYISTQVFVGNTQWELMPL